jgi:drug/metabolite transporter (DMT)-like permease
VAAVNPLVVLSYCACATIWGTTYFAIRVCIAPGGYPTYLAGALRFVLAALVLGAVVALGFARPVPRDRKAFAALFVSGALCFVSYALIYTAEERIPGGLAAVIFGTLPLLTAILSAVTGVERPTRHAVAGAVVSLGGIALISLDRLAVSRDEAVGCVMVFVAVLCSAIYNLILKRHTHRQHPLAANAVFLAVTAVLMGALAGAVEHRLPPWPPPLAPTLAILYLAVVGTVVAFAGYFYLLRHVSLMTVSTLVLVQPIIALLVDAIFETQQIATRTYVGAAVTLAGVALNLAGSARR